MARYDKYDPKDGGFRAPLAADIAAADGETVYGVGLDTSGHVVIGGGNTGIVGVLIAHGEKFAGDVVDVMTDGEIVDVEDGAAGTVYGVDEADGALAAGAGVRVGHTVEADRLVVRVRPGVTLGGGE